MSNEPVQPAWDWQPTAKVDVLTARARLVHTIRTYFHECSILEVHTPVLSQDTVVDRYIDPVVVPGRALGVASVREVPLYLQSSPEFGMKRLLAAGMSRIYQIAPVFRAGERGAHHNPEFCMVEWYCVGDDLAQAIELLANLVSRLLATPPPHVETYQAAFTRLVGCDPLASEIDELAEQAVAHGLGVDRQWSNDHDEWLNLLFAELVQPQLGLERPSIITHYPASQSALARISDDDPRTAERFELFVAGIELANGYHELLDAEELMRRDQFVSAQRDHDGKTPLTRPGRLQAAMRSGLPACSGCALGLDRLVMVATGAQQIDEVLAFPIEIA